MYFYEHLFESGLFPSFHYIFRVHISFLHQGGGKKNGDI